jgi:hypothetical protein
MHGIEIGLSFSIVAMESSMGGAFVSNVTYSQYEMIREFICYGNGARIFYGDHLEAASAADPSFWVIHPAQERALHAKFIVGGFEDNKWNSDYIDDYVCDRNECYDDEVRRYNNPILLTVTLV